jgi:pimeloyl-ACP methyl ester carboxylesterase
VTIRRGFADLSIGQVHYAQSGDPGADAVLLLHQSPRSWLEFRDVLPLIGARYRAIAMDTAGFGDSASVPGPPSIERWAAVAAELLDALAVRQAHVVGHHTGGVIAVELASAFAPRVRSLVLSSTPFTGESFRLARAGRPPIDEVEPAGDGSHLAALWQKRQAFYPAGRPELLEAFVLDALKVGARLEEGHRAVAAYRMEDRVGRIDQPTLILRAAGDPFASPHASELCSRIAGSSLVEIVDGMVPLPDQLPDVFARAVLDFIDAIG